MKAYVGSENLHKANRKDDYDANFPSSCSLQTPDGMNGHKKNDQVRQRIADAARIEQRRYIDARPWYRLVPDSLSGCTFPYLYNSSRDVKKTQEEHEKSDSQVEAAPSMW